MTPRALQNLNCVTVFSPVGSQTLHTYASKFPAAVSASNGGRNRKAVKMLEEYVSDMTLIGIIATIAEWSIQSMLHLSAQRPRGDSSARQEKYVEVSWTSGAHPHIGR